MELTHKPLLTTGKVISVKELKESGEAHYGMFFKIVKGGNRFDIVVEGETIVLVDDSYDNLWFTGYTTEEQMQNPMTLDDTTFLEYGGIIEAYLGEAYVGEVVDVDIEEQGHNQGGSTDYYKILPQWKDLADVMESRGLNYNQGNILKSAWCFNIGRHTGTNYERELNKIIYFAKRELQRIENV